MLLFSCCSHAVSLMGLHLPSPIVLVQQDLMGSSYTGMTISPSTPLYSLLVFQILGVWVFLPNFL